MRVALHPELDDDELERGAEVVLNESLNVVLARGAELTGEVVTLKELLDDGTRALIVGPGRRGAGAPSWPTRSSARSSAPATRC